MTATVSQKLSLHRETSTKKLSSSTPEGGEAIMRRETQCYRSDDFQSYFSLRVLFFPFFFSLFFFFARYFNAGARKVKGVARMRCARHVAAETFVIRDGAGEGRVSRSARNAG